MITSFHIIRDKNRELQTQSIQVLRMGCHDPHQYCSTTQKFSIPPLLAMAWTVAGSSRFLR